MTKIFFPVYLDELSIGGVTEFVTQLLKGFKEDMTVYGLNGECNETKISTSNRNTKKPLNFTRFYKFLKQVRKSDYVFLNTSMNTKALLRDIIYSLLCFMLKVKFVVFIHGWDKDINKSNFLIKAMSFSFKKADKIFVLSLELKNYLLLLGLPEDRISTYSTMVDEELINYIDTGEHKKEPNSPLAFLFIGRIIKEKGVYEAVDAFDGFCEQFNSNAVFNIVGDGPELDNLINYVKNRGIKNINFIGYAVGIKKFKLLVDSDVFLFPSYSEGMPICVLEAMMASNYIITTKVGAIKDFFIDQRMGISLPKCETNLIIEAISTLDRNQINKVSMYNKSYALNNFRSSVVVNNIVRNIFGETSK